MTLRPCAAYEDKCWSWSRIFPSTAGYEYPKPSLPSTAPKPCPNHQRRVSGCPKPAALNRGCEVEGPAVRLTSIQLSGKRGPTPHTLSQPRTTGAPHPRFPVRFTRFHKLHASFLKERRTRDLVQCCVQ